MRYTLEDRLSDYEKKRPIKSDGELAAALDEIIERERKITPKKRDYELIDEATALLLAIRGDDVEEIDLHADAISLEALKTDDEKGSVGGIRTRRLIPALIAAAVIIFAGVIAYAKGDEIIALFTREEIESYEIGKTYKKNGEDVVVGKDIGGDIKTLRDIAQNIDRPGLLLPLGLEESLDIEKIDLADYGTYKEISIYMNCDGKRDEIEIKTDKSLGVKLDTLKIGRYDVFITHYDDIYQGEFDYSGCAYCISAHSYERLTELINGMEEIGE